MRDRTRRPIRYPPGEALLALYRRRGPVINAGIAGLGYTYLLGPEANKFVFRLMGGSNNAPTLTFTR